MKKINLYVLGTLWRMFKVACAQREVSASSVVSELMRQQLATWQKEEQ